MIHIKKAMLAILLLGACSLTPAFAKKSRAPPPPPVECVALMETLQKIHVDKPIAASLVVKPEIGNPLRNWVGTIPPVDKNPYDLVVVVAHQDGQYGVLVGWRKDPKLGAASLCAGILITPAHAAEFERITGLKPSDNPAKPKDDGSI